MQAIGYNPRTSNMLRSCDKVLMYTSRTSVYVVGTVIPKESKRSGSIRRLLEAIFPFFCLTEDTFSPVKASLAFISILSRTSNESSTFFRNARRLKGTSGEDSADSSEDENLRRSRILMVSITSGVVNVGNSVVIHFESFLYAPSSSTREQDDRRQ